MFTKFCKFASFIVACSHGPILHNYYQHNRLREAGAACARQREPSSLLNKKAKENEETKLSWNEKLVHNMTGS